MLTSTGKPVNIDEAFDFDSGRGQTLHPDLDVGAGWLIALKLTPVSATPRRGESAARVMIVRAGVERAFLAQDYLQTGLVLPVFPNGRFSSLLDPPGAIRTIVGTNPAAGAESTETIPTNVRWRLLSYSIVLVTSSDVVTRVVNLMIDDGTTARRRLFARGSDQAESLTRTHLFELGPASPVGQANFNISDTDTVTVNPNLQDLGYLPQGYRIRTLTSSLNAADDLAAPIFQVEQLLED